jgi:hypothetical protein
MKELNPQRRHAIKAFNGYQKAEMEFSNCEKMPVFCGIDRTDELGISVDIISKERQKYDLPTLDFQRAEKLNIERRFRPGICGEPHNNLNASENGRDCSHDIKNVRNAAIIELLDLQSRDTSFG